MRQECAATLFIEKVLENKTGMSKNAGWCLS